MAFTIRSESEYEDLVASWADLESGLAVILSSPNSAQEFIQRIRQYDHWMQQLMQQDTDVGLYLLFQLASNSHAGYSAAHALISAALCHLVAARIGITAAERDSLVHAALTMNIAMTQLQNVLAKQMDKPTPEQQEGIRTHSSQGAVMLTQLGVTDRYWIDIVATHHNDAHDHLSYEQAPTSVRLSRILKTVDRYAAMVSPRQSRAARTGAESAQSLLNATPNAESIANALVQSVGVYPPGTYVRMDNEALGIVVRRNDTGQTPWVAVLSEGGGELLEMPMLVNTAHHAPHIQTPLQATAVRAYLNHFRILRVSALATPRAA